MYSAMRRNRADLEKLTHQCDEIEQIWGNVLTNATKHKKTIVHKRFRQKKSSSGVRRETDNKRRRMQRRGQTKKELMYKNIETHVEFEFSVAALRPQRL